MHLVLHYYISYLILYFKCFVFLTEFWVQFYASGTPLLHIILNFCQVNSVLEGILGGFAFRKVFFGHSVSGKVFFG